MRPIGNLSLLLAFAAILGGESLAAAPAVAPRTPAATPRTPVGTQPRTPAGAAAPASATAGAMTRTRAQVEALIQQAGTTPPDWWNSVTANPPATLDLTWAETKGPWNPNKNLGQYIWSTINENSGKWREGAKLMHQVLTVNKGDPVKLARTMDALGRIYHTLLADYARAAFWWRKAKVTSPGTAADHDTDLAHCYWKLGCREMTVEILNKYPQDDSRHGELIKLWSEMGDLDKALALAEGMAKAGYPDIGYLAAGDACRLAGKFKEAMAYYQKVLAASQGWRDLKQNKTRAQASLDGLQAAEGLDLARVRDGTYKATSMGYAGPIEVEVQARGGRIVSVKVLKYVEKQYYTALTDTPAQIVAKQGIKGVDAVTSATITSEAIMNATVKALVQGMK